jgi:hypothetical protein
MNTIKKAFVSAIIVVGILIAVSSIDYFDRIKTSVPLYNNLLPKGETWLESGLAIEQNIYAYTKFNRITFLVNELGEDDKIAFKIINKKSNLILYSVEIKADDLVASKYSGRQLINISPKGMKNSLDEGHYSILINNIGKRAVSFSLEDEGIYNAISTINGVGKLDIGLFKQSRFAYGLIIFFFCSIFLYLFYIFYLYYSKNLKIKQFYLLTVMILGLIVYLVLFPAWSTNDAYVHFLASYRYSNIISGMKFSDAWKARISDDRFIRLIWKGCGAGIYPSPSVENYYPIFSSLKEIFADNIQPVESNSAPNMLFYKIINYFP